MYIIGFYVFMCFFQKFVQINYLRTINLPSVLPSNLRFKLVIVVEYIFNLLRLVSSLRKHSIYIFSSFEVNLRLIQKHRSGV